MFAALVSGLDQGFIPQGVTVIAYEVSAIDGVSMDGLFIESVGPEGAEACYLACPPARRIACEASEDVVANRLGGMHPRFVLVDGVALASLEAAIANPAATAAEFRTASEAVVASKAV
jgi:hypothetical protein